MRKLISGDTDKLRRKFITTALGGGAGIVACRQSNATPVACKALDKLPEQIRIFDYMTPAQIADILEGATLPDVTVAFQAAINHVISLATTLNKTYGLPSIDIPGGRYKLTDSLNIFPWVTIVSRGSVVLDFSGIAISKPGFICSNMTPISQDSLKHPANHAPFLNGHGGAITVLGPGKSASTSAALKLGNFAPGGQPFRDVRVSNLVVTGWGYAQEFGAYDTYLFHAESCRFEDNRICIKTKTGTGSNSGERMTWHACTFASADTVIDHNSSGFDVNFIDCSFDFNGDIVKFGRDSSYCAVRMSQCYFEAFGGYIVNGNALIGLASANQVSVTVSDPIVLPRDRTGDASLNSPSRKIFTGAFSLSLKNVKLRHEKRPYLEDGCIIAPTVVVVEANGYHPVPWSGPLRLGTVVNADFDFQKEAVGTNADVLTAWEQVTGSITTIATRDIYDFLGKKVLRLVSNSGTNTSNVAFRSKGKIPARAGDVFWTNLCLNASRATGNIGTQAWMEFFDDNDISLGVYPSFARYIFRDALNDKSLPNYASGNVRWMDTGAFRCVAPENTVYGKMKFMLDGFNGTVYFSRARCWRDN